MLYLILPYFNFNESNFSKKNLDLFISNYSCRDNLKIILVEGVYDKELPDYSNKIYKHLKFKLENILWVKENLINLAIKNLPIDAEFIAWSDRDLYFLNPFWVEETINKLKIKDIIQPWSEVIHLNSNNELEIIKKSEYFSFSSKSILSKFSKKDKSLGFSCGQIWAINRKFYDKIGKINDIEIVGGADSIIANFCIVQNKYYYSRMIKKQTIASLRNWNKYKEFFKDFSYGYINGTIAHYWHGDMAKRDYENRHNILTEENYNPEHDIFYDDYGVINLTKDGERLKEKIKNYFISREENEKTSINSTNHMFSSGYTLQKCIIPKIKKFKK
jgi:hypothetical protein